MLLYIHSAYIESTLRISVTKSKMPKFMEKLLFSELILIEFLFVGIVILCLRERFFSFLLMLEVALGTFKAK